MDQKVSSQFELDNMLELIFKDRLRYASLHSAAINNELQTPLIIIQGLVDNLLKGGVKNPEKQLREIAEETRRLIAALERLVFIHPVEPFEMKKFSIRNAIDDVLKFFEKEFLEKGISIRIDADTKLHINSDPNRLKSILSALIQNAIESFDENQKKESKSISIHAFEENDGFHLSISDTGQGISKDLQKKIIEDIFINRNVMPVRLGLGLALAKKVANDLDIAIGFVSEESRGTNFTLTFKKQLFSKV